MFKRTDKSKNFFQNATDTFLELFLILVASIVVSGVLYSLFEGKNLLEGLWWALITGFAVGYGDTVPHSIGAQVVGTLLMSLVTFVIIPLVIVMFFKNQFDAQNKEIVETLRFLNEVETKRQNQDVPSLKLGVNSRSSKKGK